MSCDWPLDEQQALLQYKSFSYELNDTLRTGRVLPAELVQLCATLDRAINRSALDAPLTVYRAGWWVHPELRPGEIFQEPAYMSTARDPILIGMHFEQAEAPARFRIDCPAGSRVVDVERVPGAGGDEGELLIGRGARFQLISLTRVEDTSSIEKITGKRPYLAYTFLYEVHAAYIGGLAVQPLTESQPTTTER